MRGLWITFDNLKHILADYFLGSFNFVKCCSMLSIVFNGISLDSLLPDCSGFDCIKHHKQYYLPLAPDNPYIADKKA